MRRRVFLLRIALSKMSAVPGLGICMGERAFRNNDLRAGSI